MKYFLTQKILLVLLFCIPSFLYAETSPTITANENVDDFAMGKKML